MRVGLPPGKGGPARHTQKWYNVSASLYACAWESKALFLSGQPAKTFQRQAEQGGHAQDQQRGPKKGCTGQRIGVRPAVGLMTQAPGPGLGSPLISRTDLGKEATLSSVLKGRRGSWSPLLRVGLRSCPGRAAGRLAGHRSSRAPPGLGLAARRRERWRCDTG